MEEIFSRLLTTPNIAVIGIFVLPILGWTITSTVQSRHAARIREAEINLKREMIAQGRSADEIEKILRMKV